MGRGANADELLYGKLAPTRHGPADRTPKPCASGFRANCDGYRHYIFDEGGEPQCCGRVLPTGECCGNAVPSPAGWIDDGPCPNAAPEEGVPF